MLSVWWNVPTEKLESCSILPSQLAKLAGATMRDRWNTWLEITYHDIRYLWQKLARFYAKVAWHQMLGTCGFSGPCSHELAYVCLAMCHLACHSPNPFCLTRVSYLKSSILILSAVYPTLSAVPPRRRVYRPITNLQGVSSLESIVCGDIQEITKSTWRSVFVGVYRELDTLFLFSIMNSWYYLSHVTRKIPSCLTL